MEELGEVQALVVSDLVQRSREQVGEALELVEWEDEREYVTVATEATGWWSLSPKSGDSGNQLIRIVIHVY